MGRSFYGKDNLSSTIIWAAVIMAGILAVTEDSSKIIPILGGTAVHIFIRCTIKEKVNQYY